MKPSSRTPEGEPNRCPICGQSLHVEPSRPPGDAPCPFCGSLMWFNSLLGRDSDDEAAMGTQLRIRLRFRGGAKDGMVIRGNASEVAQRHGRRYCGLALHGQVGTQWCEVPEREYWHIHEVLKPYGSVQHLSRDDLQDIVRELAGVQTHIYEIVQVERTEGDVFMRLRFLRKGQGV